MVHIPRPPNGKFDTVDLADELRAVALADVCAAWLIGRVLKPRGRYAAEIGCPGKPKCRMEVVRIGKGVRIAGIRAGAGDVVLQIQRGIRCRDNVAVDKQRIGHIPLDGQVNGVVGYLGCIARLDGQVADIAAGEATVGKPMHQLGSDSSVWPCEDDDGGVRRLKALAGTCGGGSRR